MSSGLEYEIFGKFKMTEEGGHGFPDTYWFSVDELREAGADKSEVQEKIDEYEGKLAAAGVADMDDWSSDSEG